MSAAAHEVNGSDLQPFDVTFFFSFAADRKREARHTLGSLADEIRVTTAPEKSKLPWLKLAKFGDQRSDKNSLRHDPNVLAVTGIEADYDGEVIPYDEAVETLTKAGISGIVYTSPSHTPERPRWRVVCPLLEPVTPERRAKMLGRLNGLFRGALSGESWTLSQSYYYGSVAHNPAHQVDVIDGEPIDTLDELDRIWQGKPHTASTANGSAAGHSGPVDEAALLAEIVSGRSYHASAVRLLGKWARDGVSYMDARKRLIEAMESVLPPDRDARWQARRDDVDRCLDGIYVKDAAARDARTPSAPEPAAAIAAVVARFNDLYMVVNEAGKVVIFQPGYDPILKRRRYDRMSAADLRILYLNELVEVGVDDKGNPVLKGAADVWLRHRDRRQFRAGVTFDPSNAARPGVLNLWQGYAVKPVAGDWSLMKSHIRSIICDSDPVRFDYLMGWMARMLQNPAEQGEVAVVMKGGEGTGKGTLARVLKHIIGDHALAIANGKHLVGNFNSHLRDVVFLFADEAFFAGDRAHVGVLKSIITEPYLTVEAKYSNAMEVPNYLHLMMASNEEWVVPAALDARRFFVLEVTDVAKNQHEYFAEIWAQMDAGGYAAMLHDLLHHNLSTFNVRVVPTTEGLQRQRKLSLPTTEAWWLDCLERGYVFRSRLGLEALLSVWQPKVTTELLHASYVDFAKAHGERRILTRESLGRFFVSQGAKAGRWRNGVVGEHLADEENMYGGTSRKARLVQQDRATGYHVGDIGPARDAFMETTGLKIEWEDGVDEEEIDD